MKAKSQKTNKSKGETVICKTVSLPKELFESAVNLFVDDPEMDFSKYVRTLIRKDLQSQTKSA